MPSKRSSNDIVLFSTDDPRPLVRWLCDTYGMQAILRSVAEYRPTSEVAQTPAKRAYKKRGPKKGSQRGSKKGGAKKGGGQRGRKSTGGAGETGNG